MTPIYIYSIENIRGEFFVGSTSDVDSRISEHKAEENGAKIYLGKRSLDKWIVRVHDVFMSTPSSNICKTQEKHWMRLLGAENGRPWTRQHTVTGNAEVS